MGHSNEMCFHTCEPFCGGICYFLYGYGSGVCNGAHMYVWVHVYAHMWGAELDLGYLYSDVACLVLETVSHLALNLPSHLALNLPIQLG